MFSIGFMSGLQAYLFLGPNIAADLNQYLNSFIKKAIGSIQIETGNIKIGNTILVLELLNLKILYGGRAIKYI